MEKLLFVGDLHRPYHDKRAWDLVLKAARAFAPDVIADLGDHGDWYAVSDHSRNPLRRTMLKMEIADANVALDELDDLGARRKIFTRGNHEYRMDRYINDRAPELHELVSVGDSYKLAQRGWQDVAYMDHTNIGKLHLTHDVGSAGRIAVYRAAELFEHSVVTGHTHRLAYVVEGNALGTNKVSASFGWLGDVMQMDYMSRAKAKKDWALGFGYGYHDLATGYVYLVPVPIVDYTCVVAGTRWSVPAPRSRRVAA
jgi:predicted phosphodiesterase